MKIPAIAMLLVGSTFFSISQAQADSEPPPAQDFATMKANVLARLEKETACVQAATSFESMHACRPPPPDGAHHGPPPPDK